MKFKAKDSEITTYPLCLGNIAKDWTVDNIKKTGLKDYVFDFSFDYNAIAAANILDIYKHLTKNFDCSLKHILELDSMALHLIYYNQKTSLLKLIFALQIWVFYAFYYILCFLFYASTMMLFGCNISSVSSLNAVPKCVSMNNQEYKVKPEIININCM